MIKREYGWEITIDFLGNPNHQIQIVCDKEDDYYRWKNLGEIACGMQRNEFEIERSMKSGLFKLEREGAIKGTQYINPSSIEKITIIEIDQSYQELRSKRI